MICSPFVRPSSVTSWRERANACRIQLWNARTSDGTPPLLMRGSLCVNGLPGPRLRLAAIGCSVRTRFGSMRSIYTLRGREQPEQRPPYHYSPGCPSRGSASIPQLFTFTFSGSASLKVIRVSGRSLMSFLPVRSATVVPAPAPTGPPISAPVPPPASPLYASPSQ